MELFLISSRNGPMGWMRASSSWYSRSLAGLASDKASCVAAKFVHSTRFPEGRTWALAARRHFDATFRSCWIASGWPTW